MRTSRVVSSAVAAVMLLAVTACTSYGGSDDPSSPDSTVTTVDGLTLERDGVVVEIPAGAVPEGTTVDLEKRSDPAPTTEDHVASAGDGHDLTLGDDLQPAVPITFTVPVEEPADTDASGWALVLESADGELDVVEADYDASSGTVTGSVPHLSGIWPVRIDLGSLWNDAVRELKESTGLRQPDPGCTEDTATVGSTTYSVTSHDQAWMCVAETDGSLEVTASSSSAMPYIVTSNRPATNTGPISKVDLKTALVRVLTDRFYVTGADQESMFPGSDAVFLYDGAPRAVELTFDQDPAILNLRILAEVLDVLVGGIDATLIERIGNAECFTGVLPAVGTIAKNGGVTYDLVSDIYQAFFDCVEPIVEQFGKLNVMQRAVLAIVAGAPQYLVANVYGAVAEVVGQDEFTITIDQDSDVGEVDASAFLGLWTGDIEQPDSSTDYTVRLTLKLDSGGRLVGSVRYPELGNCAGYLTDPVIDGDELRMTEIITRNTSRCLDEVPLVLTLADGGLRYDALDGLATGFLTRADAAIDASTAAPYLGTWVGDVDQPSSSRDYTVRLTLSWNGTALVGDTVYPELGSCRGTLTDFEIIDGELHAAEVITYVGDTCIDTNLVLGVDGDTMDYRFNGRVEGTGTLARVG